MKKFKKVLAFVAACSMALAMLIPFTAMADITLNVEKPADWDTVCFWPFTVMKDGAELDSTFNPDVVPSVWPGWEMTKGADGNYTYTIAADSFDCCIANSEGNSQSVDLKGFTTGTWSITKGVANADGKYEFTVASADGAAPTTDATPKTGDMAPIAVVAVIGVASIVVVLATRKKAIA